MVPNIPLHYLTHCGVCDPKDLWQMASGCGDLSQNDPLEIETSEAVKTIVLCSMSARPATKTQQMSRTKSSMRLHVYSWNMANAFTPWPSSPLQAFWGVGLKRSTRQVSSLLLKQGCGAKTFFSASHSKRMTADRTSTFRSLKYRQQREEGCASETLQSYKLAFSGDRNIYAGILFQPLLPQHCWFLNSWLVRRHRVIFLALCDCTSGWAVNHRLKETCSFYIHTYGWTVHVNRLNKSTQVLIVWSFLWGNVYWAFLEVVSGVSVL